MDKSRPCGCKGCRTCLICEKTFGISKQQDIDKVCYLILLITIPYNTIFFRVMGLTFTVRGVIKHGLVGIPTITKVIQNMMEVR